MARSRVSNHNGQVVLAKPRRFVGGGGAGGKGAGSGSGGKEEKDTLFSRSFVRLKEAISQGPIYGFSDLLNPLKCIFLDDTPIENSEGGPVYFDGITANHSTTFQTATTPLTNDMVGRGITGDNLPDFTRIVSVESTHSCTLNNKATATGSATTWALGGVLNFRNFQYYMLTGTGDQSYLPGFDAEETSFPVGVRVKQSSWWTSPTISEADIDAIRVDVRYPQLEKYAANGDITGTSVEVQIQLQSGGAGYQTVIDDTVNGKASQPYVRTYVIDLAGIPPPWNVRVVRVTDDSSKQNLHNDTYVDSYTTVIYGKLVHPNIAHVGVVISAEQFSQIPVRSYRIKGLLVQIPSNYNPVTRVYTGIWDGTFTTAWTNNPAWCFYDMLTNKRYGLGKYVDATAVDKFTLYAIGQYCDGMVSDGNGGTEPRMTCNLFLQKQEDAMKVLGDMAGIFRGMIYYMNGTVSATQDAPATPQFLFTPDNVVDGRFTYSGTAVRARHTVARVKWNDLTDAGREKVEYVEDLQGIIVFGVNALDITGFGCTSRGQAHRIGVWSLAVERLLTDTVTFSTGIEGFFCPPGSVISIQDPFRAGQTLSGRLIPGSTTTNLLLDRSITLLSGRTYTVQIVDPASSSIVSRAVTNGAGATTSLSLGSALPSVPASDAVFMLAANDLAPQTYRIVSMAQRSPEVCDITALQYSDAIYPFVETGLVLEEPPTSSLGDPNVVQPPQLPITFTDIPYVTPNGVTHRLQVMWGPSSDEFLKDYRVSVRFDRGNWHLVDIVNVAQTTIDVPQDGLYEVSIVATNYAGTTSEPISDGHFVSGSPFGPPQVSGLELWNQGNDTVFDGRDAHFVWRLNSKIAGKVYWWDDPYGGPIYDPYFSAFDIRVLRPAATRTVPLVSTDSTTATVTGPPGSFTGADVGSAVTGSGIPAGTTIISVTDNTGSAVLSVMPTATASVTLTLSRAAALVLGGLMFPVNTTDFQYFFTLADNIKANGGTLAMDSFEFQVRVRDKWNNLTLPEVLDVTHNPTVEAMTGVTVTGALGQILFAWNPPLDDTTRDVIVRFDGPTNPIRTIMDARTTSKVLLGVTRDINYNVYVAFRNVFGQIGPQSGPFNITSSAPPHQAIYAATTVMAPNGGTVPSGSWSLFMQGDGTIDQIGCRLFYRTDTNPPTPLDSEYNLLGGSGAAISLTGAQTISARLYVGSIPGPQIIRVFSTTANVLQTPWFQPVPGTYYTSNGTMNVKFRAGSPVGSDSAADYFFYTTDGSAPTHTGSTATGTTTRVAGPSPIMVFPNGTTRIRMVAYKSGWTDSTIDQTFHIEQNGACPPQRVPASGTGSFGQEGGGAGTIVL
jgi:predicted phage tail protein